MQGTRWESSFWGTWSTACTAARTDPRERAQDLPFWGQKTRNGYLIKLIYIYFMNLEPLMDQIIEKMPKGQYPSINKADIESL